MGKRTEHAPGTFSWVDLATGDATGAKAFYGGLFGWQAEDAPAGEGGTYTMLSLDGDQVGGLYELSDEMRERGVPSNWLSYVTVASADQAAARAADLGGNVHAGPFDVLEAGRMALLQDPAGAMLATWEPRASIGATRVNDPGCLSWNELATPDIEGAMAFYGGLFGWETEPLDTHGGPPYAVIRLNGRLNGGITALRPEVHGGAPPHWLPYFTTESVEGSLSEAERLEGTALAGPVEVGAGRIGAVADPQGASFALFEGDVDD